jgi:aspartate racemase
MKTIGLIGGMSWESTLEYYRLINLKFRERLGGQNSAKILMYSVNFEDIRHLQCTGNWEASARELTACALKLEKGGADLIAICTNTMHKVAPEIQKSLRVPLLHIADAVAEAILEKGFRTVGLLGTTFTMEDGFYSQRLSDHGLTVLVPPREDRDFIHHTIFSELCQSKLLPTTARRYHAIIESLAKRGADGVILGCTEIGLLVRQEDNPIPLFDTTKVHVGKIVDLALS